MGSLLHEPPLHAIVVPVQYRGYGYDLLPNFSDSLLVMKSIATPKKRLPNKDWGRLRWINIDKHERNIH